MADVLIDVNSGEGYNFHPPEYSATTQLRNNVFVHIHSTYDTDAIIVSVFRIDGIKSAAPSNTRLASRLFDNDQLNAAGISDIFFSSNGFVNKELCRLNDTDILVKMQSATSSLFTVLRIDPATNDPQFVGNVISATENIYVSGGRADEFGPGAMMNIADDVVMTDIVVAQKPQVHRFNWDSENDVLSLNQVTTAMPAYGTQSAYFTRFTKSRTFGDDEKMLYSYGVYSGANNSNVNQAQYQAISQAMAYGGAENNWTVYDTGLGDNEPRDLGVVLPVSSTVSIHLNSPTGAEKLVNGNTVFDYPAWNTMTGLGVYSRVKWASWLDENHFIVVIQSTNTTVTNPSATRYAVVCQYNEADDTITPSPLTTNGVLISEMNNTNNDHANRIHVYDAETILFYNHDTNGAPVVKIITTAA